MEPGSSAINAKVLWLRTGSLQLLKFGWLRDVYTLEVNQVVDCGPVEETDDSWRDRETRNLETVEIGKGSGS